MSEEEDKTQKSRLEKRRQILDEYEKTLGLPGNNFPGERAEYEEYFSMDRKHIESLHPESCLAIAARLAQLGIYITRSINRERGNLMWAEEQLNNLVAGQIHQFDSYMKHDIKVAKICRTDAAAAELKRICNYANERINRLEGMADGIRNLSHFISMLNKVKYDRQFSKQTS